MMRYILIEVIKKVTLKYTNLKSWYNIIRVIELMECVNNTNYMSRKQIC